MLFGTPQDELPTEFLIDQFFNVAGVGLVVAGTLLSGLVTVNQLLLMGPNLQGKFNLVTVKVSECRGERRRPRCEL